MDTPSFLWIMLGHLLWCALLYAGLTLLRAPKIWGLFSHIHFSSDYEPKLTANLKNQFEWPLFFHIGGLLLVLNGFTSFEFWMGILFLFGRVVHTCVHVFCSSVRLRGVVFTINFLAVIVLWISMTFRF